MAGAAHASAAGPKLMPTSTTSPPPPTSPVSARSASGSPQRDGRSPPDQAGPRKPLRSFARSHSASTPPRHPPPAKTTKATTPSTDQPPPQPDPFDTSHLAAS